MELEAYLSDLAAGAAAQTFTVGPATGLAPPAPGRLPSATYQAMEDRRMWTLDASWLPTAVFSDQTVCVRIANFGGGYVTSKPYINPDVPAGGCRNWAGSDVPPSCSWAVWRVAGCDSQTMLSALFQLPRYLWAQKMLLGMLASKPTAAQFGPALGDAQASWVNDALSLVSALVYSTNIRFDDDGAFNWGNAREGTFAAALKTAGVLLEARTALSGGGFVAPRFYNDMSTRPSKAAPRADAERARSVPVSKEDFAPQVSLPPQPTVRHVDSLYNDLNARRAPALEKLKALARYSPAEFATVFAEAERQIRHYSTASFFRWQQVAIERWLLSLQSILSLIPARDDLDLQRMKNDVALAMRTLSTLPEASLRAATAEEVSKIGNNPYAAIIQTIVGLINSTAGVVMAVIQPLLDALSRALVEAAGAATGRPALCPSLPYLRIFDRADCTVDIEQELQRIAAGAGPGPGPGPTAPPPPPPMCPPGTTGTWPRCTTTPKTEKSGAAPLLIGAGALLLLSRLVK